MKAFVNQSDWRERDRQTETERQEADRQSKRDRDFLYRIRDVFLSLSFGCIFWRASSCFLNKQTTTTIKKKNIKKNKKRTFWYEFVLKREACQQLWFLSLVALTDIVSREVQSGYVRFIVVMQSTSSCCGDLLLCNPLPLIPAILTQSTDCIEFRFAFLQYTPKPVAHVPFHTLHSPPRTTCLKVYETQNLLLHSSSVHNQKNQ